MVGCSIEIRPVFLVAGMVAIFPVPIPDTMESTPKALWNLLYLKTKLRGILNSKILKVSLWT
jgi:hypothetical protein